MLNLLSVPISSLSTYKTALHIVKSLGHAMSIMCIFSLALTAHAASDEESLEQTQPSILSSNTDNSTSNVDLCWQSFEQIRQQVTGNNLQSVIIQSDSKGLIPYVTLHQRNEQGENYNLWQTLNGEVRGYATKDGYGFDYTTSLSQITPLTWHPTFIWDTLFSSHKPLKNYSCVLTGRTRIMGKRATLLRMIPQEGLRYSYLIAKEDESHFPVELAVVDSRGMVAMRLTVMDSRVIMGMDFPIKNEVFDKLRRGLQVDSSILPNANESEITLNSNSPTTQPSSQAHSGLTTTQSSENTTAIATDSSKQATESSLVEGLSDITRPTPAATMTGGVPQPALIGENIQKLTPWPELNIPRDFQIIGEDKYPQAGENCIYQEYSDGITSFRVYKNTISTIRFHVLNNVTLTVLRRNSSRYEYTVVGELPLALAEHIISQVAPR